MKYRTILEEMTRGELIGRVKKASPNGFEYVVKHNGDVYSVIETNTDAVIFTTSDPNEADDTADELNHDKDAAKDALVKTLSTK